MYICIAEGGKETISIVTLTRGKRAFHCYATGPLRVFSPRFLLPVRLYTLETVIIRAREGKNLFPFKSREGRPREVRTGKF